MGFRWEGNGWPAFAWAGLFLTPLLISLGQLFFKMVGEKLSAANRSDFIFIVTDIYFWAAMVVYAAATFSWIFVLKFVPLSAAYSFTALGFIFVPALSIYFFGEQLTMRYYIGAGLIVLGLWTIHS